VEDDVEEKKKKKVDKEEEGEMNVLCFPNKAVGFSTFCGGRWYDKYLSNDMLMMMLR